MSAATALAILKLLLSLAAFFARRAERKDIETAVLAELENIHGTRVDAAVDAGNDVLAGRVPVDLKDPYRRD